MWRSPPLLLLLAIFSMASGILAQQEEKTKAPPSSLLYGVEALQRGDHTAAYQHFLYTLARAENPFAAALLLLQNAAAAEDRNAQTLWAHDVYAYGADERGHLRLKSAQSLWLPENDSWPSTLAQTRALAVRELMKFRDRKKKSRSVGDAFLGEWAEDLARSLALASPALQNRYAGELSPAITVDAALQREVLKSLQQVIRQGFSTSHPDLVVRAARCIRGLGAQAGFKDLFGPPALNMGAELASANAALARARKTLTLHRQVFTVEQLEEFDEEQQRAFTLEHASFANPGVAVSPHGLYTIETSCGYWTLLGVASTVEEHHQRLLNWYGADPFDGRPGLMRIVPESHGLEMEGAGYWWVGGFQGGDTTTLAFTLSSIPALGHGITHELTHRFDGASFGGLPAWLAEGRAVWTASNYGFIEDQGFVDDHLNFGTLFAVAQMGYGGLNKLKDLLNGKNKEYRDNYSAGYALFAYLRTWIGFDPTQSSPSGEGGFPADVSATPLFRARLDAYQKDRKRARGGGAVGFARYFADGKDGRPQDLDAFAADFDRFLRGFYWKDMQPWTARYNPIPPAGEAANRVMDEPTATWLRRRAEPWFGQDQARMAAEVLVTAGLDREALLAYRWVMAVDEPSDAVLQETAECLERVDAKDAAWVLQHWPRFSAPRRDYQNQQHLEAAPFLKQLPQLVLLMQQQEHAAIDYQQQGLDIAAAALAADRNRLAQRLGVAARPVDLEYIANKATVEAEKNVADEVKSLSLHPFHQPAQQLGLAGWFEDELSGHEKNRVEGLWFLDYQNDLHVGRKKARTGTDTMDRTALTRDAFALSRAWQEPGRYRIRCKIEQTTSFFHGGVVLGWTRRDRNLRFDFLGGDARYASGEEDSREAANGFSWSLDGLYARQPARRGGVGFEREKTTWDLELRVDGPTVEVWVDHRRVTRMTTLDARPIQGYIGFYTSTGTMRVIAPEIERRDRMAFLDHASALGMGLHPTRPGVSHMRDLLDRPVSGLPLSGAGTAILWIPEERAVHQKQLQTGDWRTHIEESIDRFLEQWQIENPSQGVTVVLPEALPREDCQNLQQRYASGLLEEIESPRGGLFWATHPSRPDLFESGMTVGGWKRPILLFADPAGILRFARRLSRSRAGFHRDFLHQLLEYQDHQRSGQAGADD